MLYFDGMGLTRSRSVFYLLFVISNGLTLDIYLSPRAKIRYMMERAFSEEANLHAPRVVDILFTTNNPLSCNDPFY